MTLKPIEKGKPTFLLDIDGKPLFDGDKVPSWNIRHPEDASFKEIRAGAADKIPVPCTVRCGDHQGTEWWYIEVDEALGGGTTGISGGAGSASPQFGVRKI